MFSWWQIAEFTFAFALAFLLGRVYIRWDEKNPLRESRRRLGIVCPKCDYDLTGNVSGTCPECGGKVR
ncbi:MAG TPA: hypothetical protein VG269_16815 [Tepidisphaeraceae bacterium]|nr:hypothetical protein [Tepidisphaeraceae bacterium]